MTAWILYCPECGFVGTERDFQMSLADECFCPQCDCEFTLDTGDEDE